MQKPKFGYNKTRGTFHCWYCYGYNHYARVCTSWGPAPESVRKKWPNPVPNDGPERKLDPQGQVSMSN